jgi:WD40 repeat protein
MKRACCAFVVTCSFLVPLVGPRAQDQPAAPSIPARYQAIAKTPHTRLLEVYGSPEVQPGFGATAAYSANGKWAVFASTMPTGDDNTPPMSQLFVWDVEHGSLAKEIPLDGRAITALALSADGAQALLGALTIDAKSKMPGYPLLVVDVAGGKEIRSFGSHKNPVFRLAVSPDGKHALSGSIGTCKQWDLDTGKELTPIAVGESKVVAALAYLPDGKRALTGSAGEVRLCDLGTGKEVRTYKSKAPTSAALGLTVSADGKRFVSADTEPVASLWETDTGKEIGVWSKPGGGPTAVSAEPILLDDGQGAIVCWGLADLIGGVRESARVVRFDAAGKEVWSKSVPMQGMVPARLNGKNLLLGGGANPFCVWNPADGSELRRWGGPKGAVTALVRTAAGDLLSASNDGLLYRCAHGNQATAWRAHDAAINAMAMSRDRKLLLTASADKTVKLHDAAKGTPLCTLQGHTGNVTSVAFGPDQAWAASGSDDRTVILWDLKEGKKRYTLEGHAEGVNAIAISPQGDWLASASDDNTIRIWPIKDGKPDPERDPIVLDQHTRQVTCVTFSVDGKEVLSAGQDQTIKLWDLGQQKVLREFKGHKNWISAAIFAGPDRVLSASDDLTVRLWDAQSGKELDRIDLSTVSDGPRSVLILGDGEFAVGTSGWVVLRVGLAR